MSRESHTSPRLATPVGPFTHAVHSAELVFLSGQVGQDPSTGALVEGGVSGQARQILANLHTLLEELALGFDDVIKINIFLASMAGFAQVNAVYAEHFTAPYSARTTVAVRELPLGALVEMEAIARKR
jgi:2-iminobutanoate/2-iminopropanoate deaminase